MGETTKGVGEWICALKDSIEAVVTFRVEATSAVYRTQV